MNEVTEAHLQAVRAELHARLAEHKAEVNVTMRELTAEVRSARREQQGEAATMLKRLDALTTSVDSMESGTDRDAWMHDLKMSIARRTAAGLTLAATVGGVVIALVDLLAK